MDIRLAVLQDIPGILNLQKKYLYENLSNEDKSQGFVTTPFTMEQVAYVIKEHGLFVAADHENISAYIFTGSWDFFSQWPIFPFMNTRFPGLTFKKQEITIKNSFQYGPICIDIEYRGQGLISLLFETMRKELVKQFPLGITFINKLNKRSFNAHVHKLNWTVIDEFSYNGRDYWGLAYDMREPLQYKTDAISIPK